MQHPPHRNLYRSSCGRLHQQENRREYDRPARNGQNKQQKHAVCACYPFNTLPGFGRSRRRPFGRKCVISALSTPRHRIARIGMH